MKKLLFLVAWFGLVACSSDSTEEKQENITSHPFGVMASGDSITAYVL